MSNEDYELDELNEALSGADVSHAVLPDEPQTETAKAKDPEDDRDNWPKIEIDFEDGKPNFAFVSVSGTKKDGRPFTHDLRVQRGVEVAVPPSIVNMLRSTKRTVYHQTQDPQTGRNILHSNDRPPLPWRLVEKGKYIK